MSQLMISVAGIRGIVGDSIQPEQFVRFTLAFAEGCRKKLVVIGGDARPSGPMLRTLVIGALESMGMDVVDLGIVPTPTVGFMTRDLGAGGGIAVTASHNPVEWNALKFFRPDGTFLNASDNAKLMQRVEAGNFKLATVHHLGEACAHARPLENHLDKVLEFVDVQAIRKAKIKVALDACNGAGYQALPQLLDRLKCDTVTIFGEPTGDCPRVFEPLPEHLGALSTVVKSHGARVGFAVDPDADRLALVDETGRPIGEERTITLVADHLLPRLRSSVTVNLSTTRAVEDVCARHGVKCHRSKIGEAHVVGTMRRRKGQIGGEGNGGVILAPIHSGRDALSGVAVILEALAKNKCALSELNARVPDYIMSKDKVAIGRLNPEAIYTKMRQEFKDARGFNTDDGLRIDLGEAWAHLRPSGTEPIFRVFIEAPTQETVHSVMARIKKVMR